MSSRAALLRQSGEAPERARAVRRDSEAHAERQRRVVCAACRNLVTSSAAKIAINGAHWHTFINPGGVIYKIGCYQEAPGARALGEASAYWTWFPGFAWRLAACRACDAHLGWDFSGAGGTFVALIVERVSEEAEPPAAP